MESLSLNRFFRIIDGRRWLMLSSSFFIHVFGVSGQNAEITENGAFNFIPKQYSIESKFVYVSLDSIKGWATLNTNENYSKSNDLFRSNTALFYHSYSSLVSYAEAIIGFEHPICKLRVGLIEGCKYDLVVTYMVSSDAIIGNLLGVHALTRNDIQNSGLKNLQPTIEFETIKRAKREWVTVKFSFTAKGDEEFILFGTAKRRKLIPGQLFIRSVSLKPTSTECDRLLASLPIAQSLIEDKGPQIANLKTYVFDYLSGDSIPTDGVEEICSYLSEVNFVTALNIRIITRADNLGSVENNLALSKRRADYLKRKLLLCLPNYLIVNFDLVPLGELGANSCDMLYRRTEIIIEWQ